MRQNEKLFVKSFPGANMADMADYVRPTMRRGSDLVILHAGTNDLRSAKSVEDISSDIVRLALDMKSDQNDIMVSSITARADDQTLLTKSQKVNDMVKAECKKYDIYFIDNGNVNADKHLNGSKLHLNYQGTIALAKNFIDSIQL